MNRQTIIKQCARIAHAWDAEAERRQDLRTDAAYATLKTAQQAHEAAERDHKTAKEKYQQAVSGATLGTFSGKARAAHRTLTAAREREKRAQFALAEAKEQFPDTLPALAGRVYLFAVIVSLVVGFGVMLVAPAKWPSVTPHAPLVVMLAIVAWVSVMHKAVLYIGRLEPRTEVIPEGMSAEEAALMKRLDPSSWKRRAPERGLEGTLSTEPEITPAGVAVQVRMDSKWTVSALKSEEEKLRAFLQVRTGTPMKIEPGSQGDWAAIKFLTRRATDDDQLTMWTPDKIPSKKTVMSIGIDTETGEEVYAPFAERLNLSGASGAGKSWATRPLMATANTRGYLVLLDGKGDEANVWDGICRTVVEPEEIRQMIKTLFSEMHRRKKSMKAAKISVWGGDQLTALVDEGQAILAMLKGHDDILQMLIELSSQGRSRGIVLWWCTQYPTVSGKAPGMHAMISPNMITRISLRQAGRTQSQVALDEWAHYAPHKLTEKDIGHGYLGGYGPSLIRMWTLNDDGVRKLKPNVWDGGEATPEPVTKELAKVEPVTEPAPKKITNKTRVLDAILNGASTLTEIVDATGIHKATVSGAVRSLVGEGKINRDDNGKITPA